MVETNLHAHFADELHMSHFDKKAVDKQVVGKRAVDKRADADLVGGNLADDKPMLDYNYLNSCNHDVAAGLDREDSHYS